MDVELTQQEGLKALDLYYIKIFLLTLILILPTLFSQVKGFNTGTFTSGVTVAEYGELRGKILFSILFLLCVYMRIFLRYKLVWSKTVYFFIAYLWLGVIYSDYKYMVLRGIFVAVTSLVLWNQFAQAFRNKFSPLKLVNAVSTFFLCFGLLEFFLWAINPKFYYLNGYMASYIGYLLQPNLLAKLLCVGFVLRYFKMVYLGKTTKDMIILILLSILLILTGSRTSVIGLFMGICTIHLLFFREGFWQRFKLIFLLGIVVLLSIIFFPGFYNKSNSPDLFIQSTLISRYDVWKQLLPLMFKNFWLGAGINSFWNADLFETFKFTIPGIHNGYLQVFQDTGFVGFIFLIIILLPILKSFKIKGNNVETEIIRISLITLWIYFFILNFTEGDLGLYRSSLWAVLMTLSLVWFYLTKEPDKLQEEDYNEEKRI